MATKISIFGATFASPAGVKDILLALVDDREYIYNCYEDCFQDAKVLDTDVDLTAFFFDGDVTINEGIDYAFENRARYF